MNSLTPEQQDAAYAHCQTVSIREGALWIENQFNVAVSKSALGVWLQKERMEREMSEDLSRIRDTHVAAALVNDAAPDAAAPITIANSVLFATAVFHEFRKPAGQRDDRMLVRYMDLALKARELEIREKAVELSFDRFRQDLARNAPEPELDPDEERKRTEEAMIRLFGEEPDGFYSPSGLPVAETETQMAARLAAESGRSV